ncbi:hypothetical protein JTE90_022953 [Oedothorax gibbosus]|uniref:Uncharacterized protein n=1 Tax=Oedothorax gibbosus TaxID=931172 RepID=A0AAV6VCE5_9ARAC|nr:hypothetical protein JTE90_022953 [Oedothorax gibbosus]
MFSGAKMRLLKWREKKHSSWKVEIPKPLLDRNQLLEQLSTISESGDDKNSLIQQKVDFLKKNLVIIKRGLEDSQIFLALNNIVENIENEVRSNEDEIATLKERIKSLKEENNSLRRDLSMTHKKWTESERQSVTLEIECDHLKYLNTLT